MSTQTPIENLLSVKDLPFPRTTVWRLIRDGQLSCYRVGRRVYFSREHVAGLLRRCERSAMV